MAKPAFAPGAQVEHGKFGLGSVVECTEEHVKINFDELKQRSHFEAVAHMPNGKVKLNQEERTIADKLRLLKGEVSTWENNIEFFRNSKNADVLRKQIEDKIKSAEAQISKLNERLKIIKSIK